MSYGLLTALTLTRPLVCVPLWAWCYWRRPRRMVLWMTLAALGFLASDHLDGVLARQHGLISPLGAWLDHGTDAVFYGLVLFTLVRGPREASLLPRRARRRAPAPPPPDARPDVPPPPSP